MSYQKRNNKKISKKGRKEQSGGASDWWNSFNGYHMSPAELSRFTLKYIDRAPMFNPLETCGTIIPTGTSGITPTGTYLANHPSAQIKSENYLVKARPIRGTPACDCSAPIGSEAVAEAEGRPSSNLVEGGDEQVGAGKLNPACYPGHGSSFIPEYIGVTCGSGCGSCGCDGRYKAHYSSTTNNVRERPSCKLCKNNRCTGNCGQHNRACQRVFNQLMEHDRERLWALCRENNVAIYNMDQETGRLTPQNKPALCRRLAKQLVSNGVIGSQVFMS